MTLIQGYFGIIELCHNDRYDLFLADMELRCLEEIEILLRYNHNHDPNTGRFTSGSVVDNGGESGIIKLEDDFIGRSLSAKAKNYDIFDPTSGETFHFAEGTKIQNREIFAGFGTRNSLHEGVAEGLTETFGGNVNKWQHAKGTGVLNYHGEERKAEVHWFQEETVGKVKFKVKEWLE